MKEFMDKDFLLETETAKHLFHDYAEHLPLVDYHCHIPPKDVYEDVRFDNLAEVWLGGENPDGSYFGDHYKWRLMRSNGVSENDITGDADNKVRIRKFAEALEKAIGNPMYHWSNLELHKFFGVEEPLTPENSDRIYDLCAEKLHNDPNMSVRGLIKQSNVAFIGTTDDPIDSLEWHKKIAADPTITFKVCPSFRPDKAINITKPGFAEYIKKLEAERYNGNHKERKIAEADGVEPVTLVALASDKLNVVERGENQLFVNVRDSDFELGGLARDALVAEVIGKLSLKGERLPLRVSRELFAEAAEIAVRLKHKALALDLTVLERLAVNGSVGVYLDRVAELGGNILARRALHHSRLVPYIGLSRQKNLDNKHYYKHDSYPFRRLILNF